MRTATFLTTLATAAAAATGALAHAGHLDTVAGHDHWDLLGGLGVIALAGAVAVWTWRRT